MYTSRRIRSYTATVRKRNGKSHAGMTKNEFDLKKTKRRSAMSSGTSSFERLQGITIFT